MPSKKPKGDEEPLKPLSFYVKDRLELTKQLFSCLKSKQIKSRLPTNLQNKSMERIQQICLDEILGISSKRLLSIINDTKCPLDTESDSDIEHISLSEISSESDNDDVAIVSKPADNAAGTSKSQSKEPPEKGPNEPKTMLELIELEARARAIRSQLALEPVTKIELDDSDDEEVPEESPVTGPVRSNLNPQPARRKSSESSRKSIDTNKKSSDTTKKPSSSKETVENSKKTTDGIKKSSTASNKTSENKNKTPEITKKSDSSKIPNDDSKKPTDVPKKPSEPTKKDVETAKKSSSSLIDKSRKSPSPPPQPIPSKRIVVEFKLKRNFSKTSSETSLSSTSETAIPTKTETPKEITIDVKEEMITESRSSSPDVITMEQNISTYFISDSDDDEPPTKRKSPEKSPKKKIIEKAAKSPVSNQKSSQEKSSESLSSKKIEVLSVEVIKSPNNVDEIPQETSKNSQDKSESESNDKSSNDDPKSSQGNSKSIESTKSSDDPQKNSEIEMESSKEVPLNTSNESGEIVDDPNSPEKARSVDDDDDNVVNLMSDTEIDLNASDKEEEDTTKKPSTSMSDKSQVEKPKEVSHSNDSDDDIVEILHSEDDIDVHKRDKSSENPETSETWNQRYLRSSTVKSVLKTTKLASKVRGKLAATKKSQKESIQKKKDDDKEKQKEFKEKISKLEEGSLEQFQVLKETSNSSV